MKGNCINIFSRSKVRSSVFSLSEQISLMTRSKSRVTSSRQGRVKIFKLMIAQRTISLSSVSPCLCHLGTFCKQYDSSALYFLLYQISKWCQPCKLILRVKRETFVCRIIIRYFSSHFLNRLYPLEGPAPALPGLSCDPRLSFVCSDRETESSHL